ncbi:hypothetical protein [Mycobacterium sp. 48b]|uniref:hypothetical protein n=1 Tax=Mycobacterium sp. 48b TaxID=3400426 RepID=UPI003AAA96AB
MRSIQAAARPDWHQALTAPVDGRTLSDSCRLVVLAPSVAELVVQIGGWLVDRVMEGWAVTALLPTTEQDTPLRILGVSSEDIDHGLNSLAGAQSALAVAATSYCEDIRIRRLVGDALRGRSRSVTLWGDAGLSAAGSCVQYQPSTAAEAFKAHAIVSTGGVRNAVEAAETIVWGVSEIMQELG